MATGFKIGGEGDLDQIYVTPAEIRALQDAGRLTLAIQSQYGERRLWLWGSGDGWVLGDGFFSNRSSPILVGTSFNWKQVVTGVASGFGGSSAAVKMDGTLWTWGRNANGELGQLHTFTVTTPAQVGVGTNWDYVDTIGHNTYGYMIAGKTDGTLWAWGYNTEGQLGLGDQVHRSSPVQVGALSNWKAIYLSISHAVAVKTDGTLWAWGTNTSGQLGLNDATPRSSPVQVGSLTTWKQATCSTDFSMAIKTDGTLWAWGANTSGQLGLSDTDSRSSPVQVGSLTNWLLLAAGTALNYAIKTDGTLWAWGANALGQLGLSDVVPRSSPVQVGSLTTWSKLYCRGDDNIRHVLVTKTDGTLWAWGYNTEGQLGLGDQVHRSSPVQVGSLSNWVAPYLRQS